jgi:hypothetical protein
MSEAVAQGDLANPLATAVRTVVAAGRGAAPGPSGRPGARR